MPNWGKGKVPVLVVGEAPGEEEDEQGRPFVGPAGKLLRKSLAKVGVSLDDCYVTNAVICRPPKNKIADNYIDACRPRLMDLMRQSDAKVVLLLGASATKSVLVPKWPRDFGTLTRWVGWTIPDHSTGKWLCPTYHPSFLLRAGEPPVLGRIFRQHLKQAISRIDEPLLGEPLADIRQRVEVVHDRVEARRRLRQLSESSGWLAFDYETTGLKPDADHHRIVCCSFCTDEDYAWCCPINDRNLPLLSRVLRNPNLRKIASNMKFEERWTRKFCGHGVANWGWDTMLAAHVLDNRPGITSIKFQAFVHFGVGDYESSVSGLLKAKNSNAKNRIEQADMRELMIYCAIDSLLEYRLAMLQRRLLGADD